MSKNKYVGNLSTYLFDVGGVRELRDSEPGVGKLMVVVTRFLLLCAVFLALPAIAAAQPTPLAVQRVWTRDAGGNDKTTFAPGETIQFAAELNNSYGGYLIGANGTQLTVTTSFYNDTKPVDIPPGISPWTWNATAPSEQGNYTSHGQRLNFFAGLKVERQ